MAVGTQKNPITTEALKVPPFDLGGELKATPEGVVLSTMVNDGLAAKSKLESGDIIESIDGRPITAPGAVAYELLTGTPLFEGSTMEVLRAHVLRAPEPPSRRRPDAFIPAELDAIVLRCLEKSPARRYRSAAELAAAIASVPRSLR